MFEDRTEEILFRVASDPLIKEEDKPEAVALLLAMAELQGRNLPPTVRNLIDYVELNRDRLVPVATLMLEGYRNVGDKTNSSR